MALTPEEISILNRFLDSCESISDAKTAAAFGTTRNVVAHGKMLLRALNINVVSAKPAPTSKFDHALALRMLSAGCAPADVATHFGVSRESVYQLKRRKAITIRKVTPSEVLARLKNGKAA